jgi:hypothetical protein
VAADRQLIISVDDSGSAVTILSNGWVTITVQVTVVATGSYTNIADQTLLVGTTNLGQHDGGRHGDQRST